MISRDVASNEATRNLMAVNKKPNAPHRLVAGLISRIGRIGLIGQITPATALTWMLYRL